MMHRTIPLVVAIIFALAVLGPYLDGVHIDDHSTEVEQARDLEDAQRAAQTRQRFEQAAQRVCGSQAAWREAGNGIVQCFTKRGRPTMRASIRTPS